MAIRVAGQVNSFGVIETMADVVLAKGVSEKIRSDNGAEMNANMMCNRFRNGGRLDTVQ